MGSPLSISNAGERHLYNDYMFNPYRAEYYELKAQAVRCLLHSVVPTGVWVGVRVHVFATMLFRHSSLRVFTVMCVEQMFCTCTVVIVCWWEHEPGACWPLCVGGSMSLGQLASVCWWEHEPGAAGLCVLVGA